MEQPCVQIQHETVPTSLAIKEEALGDLDSYPYEFTLLHDHAAGASGEVIRAKYVIGADGARSWTRKQLGFKMEGIRTKSVWAVTDLVVVSNFPEYVEGT